MTDAVIKELRRMDSEEVEAALQQHDTEVQLAEDQRAAKKGKA